MQRYKPSVNIVANLAVIGLALTLMLPSAGLAIDVDKTMGPEKCGNCHKAEMAVWRGTPHFKTFAEMARRPKAREIAKAMGITRIKTDATCMGCHFTVANKEGAPTAIAGISCESCHGASADWVDIHNDFGGSDKSAETEDAAHKVKRIHDAVAKGMVRPDKIYDVAKNCFGCHTVPNEKLVNVGGHKAGSAFELVSWSQGMVRHTYSGGDANKPATASRKRVLYVTGRAIDLEYALRGVAKATKKDTYAVSMAKRAKIAKARLKQIQDKQAIDEMAAILAIADGAALKLNNEATLSAAADKISALIAKFAEGNDGSSLAALDALIPGPDRYKGVAAP